MKKRLLTLLLAVVTVLSVFSASSTAFAASNNEVFLHYSEKGKYKVSSLTFNVEGYDFTYKVWYPKNIKKMSKRPLLLYCNGTGSNYEMKNKTSEILEKSASRGYICLTNTDQNTGTGASMNAGLNKMIEFNGDVNSVFYSKINLNKIVSAGHSQGATCTMNLANPEKYENSVLYKAIFAASLPTEALAASPLQNCPYDSTKVSVPTCLVAGTGITDSKFICPMDTSLYPNFENLKGDVYMARIKDVEHAGSFEAMYPYMLAWFDYQLSGNAFAAKAFTGKNAELKKNSEWQDFGVRLTKKDLTIKGVTAAKKAIKVSWKRDKRVSGYQISYSTNSDFSKQKKVYVKNPKAAKTTLKKLSPGKTYYVRVRAYTRAGSKKVYSNWSQTLTAAAK